MSRNEHRRSQLVLPFGVGAMVDFKDDTLMSAGLNFWSYESNFTSNEIKNEIFKKTHIIDPRLQLKLSNMILYGKKNKINFFLQPTEKPSTRGKIKNHQSHMPFVRFPTWYFCTNASCKKMKKVKLEEQYAPRCCKKMMKPVNFLLCCENGHISDFPWYEWVHRGFDGQCSREELALETLSVPGVAGIKVKCNQCKKFRTLGGIYPKPYDSLHKLLPGGKCPGHKPWLGSNEPPDDCSKKVDFVQRASSSIYFANSISSILIPPYSKAVRKIIDDPSIWSQILRGISDPNTQQQEEDDEFEVFYTQESIDENKLKLVISIVIGNRGIDEQLLIDAVKEKFFEGKTSGQNQETDTLFRFHEFKAFLGARPHQDDRNDFDIIKQNIDEYNKDITFFISEIILVTKLRETRVLTGFSRVVPVNVGEEKVNISKNKKINWLPANEVRGEGIFIKFNEDKLLEWYEKNKSFLDQQLVKYNLWIKKTVDEEGINYARLMDLKTIKELDPFFILIHTFSHLFIKSLVQEAGYDSSSIRERLYISGDKETKMYGVLVYTSSGDSEGTLGGLVERGKPENFERTMLNLLNSEVCSNDPICLETEKQGLKDLNGAACYSCCLLPETSCEHNNTLLDRKFLFGTHENPEIGFFSHLI